MILIHVSLLKDMSVGSVSVPYTKFRYQFAKFTVAPQSVLWSPIPQLSYLDVNAAVSLNYMDVLMTHTHTYFHLLCKSKLRFSWRYLCPVTNFVNLFSCLHVVLLSRIELLLRLKDDLVLVFCIV